MEPEWQTEGQINIKRKIVITIFNEPMNAQTDRRTDIQKQMQKEYRTINGDKYILRHQVPKALVCGLVSGIDVTSQLKEWNQNQRNIA